MSGQQPNNQNPEFVRQWMSQNLMTVSSNGQQQPYPQIDPRLLGGQQTYYQPQQQPPQYGQPPRRR